MRAPKARAEILVSPHLLGRCYAPDANNAIYTLGSCFYFLLAVSACVLSFDIMAIYAIYPHSVHVWLQ